MTQPAPPRPARSRRGIGALGAPVWFAVFLGLVTAVSIAVARYRR